MRTLDFNELYERILSEKAFAAPDIKGPTSYDSLQYDYNLLENTIKLISKIIENAR